MTAPPTLRELAIQWLERNTQRNAVRNAPPEAAFRDPPLFRADGTLKTPASVEESECVPLFHALGNGTAEHTLPAAANAERSAEQDAERWQIENPLSSRPFSAGCAHCASPVALETAVPVLAGRETGGRAWIHDACWRPMREARRREAREAVELLRRLR
jgi:hypothetical protein